VDLDWKEDSLRNIF